MHVETATIPGCNTTVTQLCCGSSKLHYPAQHMHTTQLETERDQPVDGWPWLWSCSRFHQSKWSVAYVLDYPIMYPPRKKIAHFTSNMVCTCLFVCLFWSHAQLHISEYNSPGRHQDIFSIRTSAWKCLNITERPDKVFTELCYLSPRFTSENLHSVSPCLMQQNPQGLLLISPHSQIHYFQDKHTRQDPSLWISNERVVNCCLLAATDPTPTVDNRGTAGNRLPKGEDSSWLLERGIKNVHQMTWPKDAVADCPQNWNKMYDPNSQPLSFQPSISNKQLDTGLQEQIGP